MGRDYHIIRGFIFFTLYFFPGDGGLLGSTCSCGFEEEFDFFRQCLGFV